MHIDLLKNSTDFTATYFYDNVQLLICAYFESGYGAICKQDFFLHIPSNKTETWSNALKIAHNLYNQQFQGGVTCFLQKLVKASLTQFIAWCKLPKWNKTIFSNCAQHK